MLWRGISIEPQWVVLALALIAVALGRGLEFIRDWTPFLVLFFAYEVMRGFAGATGVHPHDISVLERAVFGGGMPAVWLQSFYDPSRIGPQDIGAMVLYFLHFPLPIVVGFLFWVRSRNHYWRFVSALLLMSFVAFLTYLVFPSAPPWYQYAHEIHKINDETVAKWGVDYYVSPLYTHLDPNKFAAFPSLHAAFPTLAAIYAWQSGRWLALALGLYAAAVWVAIVYLGEHYFVDALAGLVYALAATVVVEQVARRRFSRDRRLRLPRPSS